MKIETVCVVGLGYIGLPTAAMLASKGLKVIGLEVNQTVIETINRGDTHIIEPGLGELVRSAVEDGSLTACATAPQADCYMIAVPTPFREGHLPDVRFVEQATRAIAPRLTPGCLVILESTCPVGTTEHLAEWIAQERPDLRVPSVATGPSDIAIAYCPERVLPGQVIRELVSNDRVVGGLTPACADRVTEFYRLFVTGECRATDARTAEMCKLAENSFRDVNIAFANELSIICDSLDIDVWELIQHANRHPRVNILQPGPGVGGHCIAVDPWFIVASSPNEARLIRTARQVNDAKPEWVVEKVAAAMDPFRDATLACFGLSFKPNIDDLRESPALAITVELAARFPGQVLAVEPHIDALPTVLADSGVRLVSADQAIEQASVIVLLVDHHEFTSLDIAEADRFVIDTRGLWRYARAPAPSQG